MPGKEEVAKGYTEDSQQENPEVIGHDEKHEEITHDKLCYV